MAHTQTPKVILITGCSSGFGLVTAHHLAECGHHVIATMRDLDKKEALVDRTRDCKSHLEILPLDVTNIPSIKEAVKAIGDRFGIIDVLVNNAGFGMGGFFEDLSENDIREQMETNFFGVQNVTREVIPLMRQNRTGKIITISSIAGCYASPCFGAYNSSKWALEGFCESLRYELKLFGIDVLLVEPGTYHTRIFDENARYGHNFDSPQSPYFKYSQFLKRRIDEYVSQCTRKPEEIAVLIEKLIISKNPPFRTIPDAPSRIHFFLRKILPFRLYSFILEKILFQGFK